MGLTILSYGGGQDSTAILLLLLYDAEFRKLYAPGELIVVMSDTGNEHPETYAHVGRMQKLCAHHRVRFEFLTHDRNYHSGAWVGGLVAFFRKKKAIGSVAFPKTCSINLKIEPIRRFIKDYTYHAIVGTAMRAVNSLVGALRDKLTGDFLVGRYARLHGEITILLGIAAGEEKRIADADRVKWVNRYLRNVYPLIDLGWDRAACQRYIASIIGYIPMPSNCIYCPFKSKLEILWTARTFPRAFGEWVELEAEKIAANRHMDAVAKTHTTKRGESVTRVVNLNYGVNKLVLLPQILAEAEIEYAEWSDERINEYRMSHGHCNATKF